MEWLLITISLLVIIVLALPYIVKAKVNSALKKMDGYTGSVAGFRVNMFTGRFSFNTIIIREQDSTETEPLVHIPELIISFRLRQLLKRNLDLHVIVNAPEIVFVDLSSSHPAAEGHEQKVVNISSKLRETITAMMRFRLNAKIHNATIRYKKDNPSLDLTMKEINVSVTDFHNHIEMFDACVIETNGILNDGTINIVTRLFPMAYTLTLDLDMKCTSVNLVPFNNLIKAYAKVDINTGTLDFFAEVAVAHNSFEGYIKPILTELDFIGVQDKRDSFVHKVWERIVAGGINFLMNRREGQLATTIPIKGRLDELEVNAFAAFAGLLRNAFFKALRPTFEDIVSIGSPRRTTGVNQ